MASMLLNQCLFRGAPKPVNNNSLPASPLMAASSTSMKSCTPALSSLRGRDHHQVVSSSPDHVGVQKYSSVLLGARSLNKSTTTTTTTSTHVVMASTAGSEDHYCMDSINEIRSRRGPASRSSSSTAHVVTSSSCSTHRSRSSSHVVMAGRGGGGDHDETKDKDSMEDDKQALDTASQQTKLETGTPYVPIYVMLPLGVINKKCELVDLNGLAEQLKKLKSANVDGVMVDCWWGIVEAEKQVYKWTGYKHLFQVVRDSNLKLQVVMSFHACGGNVGDDFSIPLPSWIAEIGNSNGDIFFTDEAGKRNYECLSWGIDKKRVLEGRTAVEVYLDYMSSFRREFSSFFNDGTISEIEIGLGPCGELRYPSYPETHGWRYPGVGQFQCYDAYLKKSLHSAAVTLGKSNWREAPENASTYNSAPHETAFFSDGGDFDSYRGRFFLSWYAEVLIAHGDIVLSMAKNVFKGTPIAAKVAGVHWCFKSTSHAAELTAGFYNSANRDGYTAIMAMLKKHGAALNFTCVELRTEDQQSSCPEAMTDPERLVWQVLNDGWDHGLKVAAENALPCYTREGYEKILANARPFDSPDGRHLCAFTYLRMSPILFQEHHFDEFKKFVKKLHGSD